MKDSGKTSPDLAEILKSMPAESTEEVAKLGDALAAGGRVTVSDLVSQVGDEFGDSAGAKPKQALHGLVIYASRPGADKERGVVAETLAAELDAEHSDELKAFVIRQLQLCGRNQEVPALAQQLESDRLCEPAAQALVAIGGKTARDALKKALPDSADRRKATISQALDQIAIG